MEKYLLHSPWYICKTNFRSRKFPVCLFNVSMSSFFMSSTDIFSYTYTRRACCVLIVFLNVWIADSCSAYKNGTSNISFSLEKFHFITWFSNIFLSFMCTHNFMEENSCLNIWCACILQYQGRIHCNKTDGKWQKWKYL